MTESLQKAPYGSPCNRCGLCCKASLCPVAEAKYGRTEGPCPALELDGDGPGYRCGMMAGPMRFAPIRSLPLGPDRLRETLAILIGSDTGCDARTEEEGDPVRLSEVRADYDRYVAKTGRKKIRHALLAWGVMER